MSNERLVTVKAAAEKTNLEYRSLLAAVKNGLIPYYQVGASRRMVFVTEVLSIIKSKNGD